MSRPSRARALVTLGWFLVCLTVPLVQGIFHFLPEVQVSENRNLAPLPKRGLRATLPAELQDYWNDHFGFRLPLSVAASWLAVQLGATPNQDVVLGKDRWLYYSENLITGGGDRDALIAKAAERYGAFQEWLADRGVVMFLIFPIDKHNVYPEHLPDHAVRVSTSELYRHFRSYVNEHQLALNLVDISDAIYAYKPRAPSIIYFQADTHWNALGALVGSLAMHEGFAKVYPAVPVRQVSDYDQQPMYAHGGDLAAMVSVPWLYPVTNVQLTPHFPARAKRVDAGFAIPRYPPAYQPFAYVVDDPRLPTALVLRDSFMESAAPFVAEAFRRSVYVWNYDNFMQELVEQEHPEVVIYERLERGIAKVVDPAPSVTADLQALAERRRAFAACTRVVDRQSGRGAPLTFRPRAPTEEERAGVPILEVRGSAAAATVLAIAADGQEHKRVLYPRAGSALVTLAGWPRELRVETRAGALAPDAELTLTLKAVDRATLPATSK